MEQLETTVKKNWLKAIPSMPKGMTSALLYCEAIAGGVISKFVYQDPDLAQPDIIELGLSAVAAAAAGAAAMYALDWWYSPPDVQRTVVQKGAKPPSGEA